MPGAILPGMEITPQRWEYTNTYSREVFGREDQHLAGLMKEAVARGLPDIAVSADVGRMLMILTSMTRAKMAIEVGTLGGYSGIWLARGLAREPGSKLITIESEKLHADFAQEQFKKAKVADRIELRRGAALDLLPRLARELAPGSVDVIFLDAVKTEYPEYWKIVRPLIALGGLIIADNVYGSGDWWIDDVGNPSRDAADRFNRLVAGDQDFEAVAVPLRQGVLIGRRMR
jgi:caffeoyl-CoA O-methyltransferase